jgi:hypothetical protein
MTNQRTIDTPSHRGRFGWERIGSDQLAVPVIIRANGVRYCPTRIVEQEIMKKYVTLPPSVFTCITLKSFYLTAVEARLLNEININHCDQRYGTEFFTTSDVIITAADIKALSRYLNVAKDIFSKNIRAQSSYFGLFKILSDPLNQSSTILVPYITKICNGESKRLIPSKLVKPFVSISQGTIDVAPSDWDVMYLRMLCVYAENGAQQNMTKDDRLLPLSGLIYTRTQTPIVYQVCDQ